ncbi:MAG: 4-vinyl reductase [Halobacteriota archaeon]|nr:4-vinyl reductase [Halobacteriota archaeon]
MPSIVNLLRLLRLMKINPKKGEISIDKKRVLVIPAAMIPELINGMAKVVGKGGSISAIYIGSKSQSKAIVDIITGVYGEGILDTEEGFKKVLKDLIPYLGYGRAELIKLDRDKPEVVVRMVGTPTTTEEKEISDEPCCHTERGIVTGIVEHTIGKPCVGKEVKCQAMGDEYCEFVVNACEN